MRVLLVNGSSRKAGCTNAALCEVERALNEEGVETEQFFIGNEALPDCIACRKYRETVAEDKEGLMTMYNIGKNMAWLLKCITIGKENGLEHPDNEKVLTNFTR